MSAVETRVPELNTLTLEQRVGQVLCFGWQGATPEEARTVNAHARELVEQMQVGGVVVVARNLGTPEQSRRTLDELQSMSRIPLLVSIDQEGGRVNRLRPPVHEFPGNMALGAVSAGAEELAYRQARAQAAEALTVGANWNCAPVVDVNNNPANPIIGVRSFGEDPDRVARLGAAMVRGYQDGGVLAGAKHFPGHGDTSVDSHLALPTVPGGRDRLDRIELVPFRAAIAAGVGSVMTTHIVFPALDAERPATLSPAILTGLLRRDLGFDGLVVTDCLEMNAIAATVGTPRGAVEALKAGADVVLVCHTLETQRAVVRAVLAALQSGELPEERLNEAAGRVLAAKRRCIGPLPAVRDAPWLDPTHGELEREIARAAVTVVRCSSLSRPRIETAGSVCLYTAHPAGLELKREIARLHPHGTELYALQGDQDPARIYDGARSIAERVGGVPILATWPLGGSDEERQRDALERAVVDAFGGRLVLAELREPYDLVRFPEATDVFCTYGSRACQLEALVDALFGAYEPTGRLPVTIPD